MPFNLAAALESVLGRRVDLVALNQQSRPDQITVDIRERRFVEHTLQIGGDLDAFVGAIRARLDG